jgi:hypothetical protein
MNVEYVYQYREFETNPRSISAGTWSDWRLCTSDEYIHLASQIRSEGAAYQLRVLQVNYAYPSDEAVAHYKVK